MTSNASIQPILPDSQPPASPTPSEECELTVTGMTCAACVRRIERALKAVPGVADASVNLVTSRATVRFDGARADVEALGHAIVGAGYGVAAVPTEGPARAARPSSEERASVLARAEEREQRGIRRDFAIAAVLTVR